MQDHSVLKLERGGRLVNLTSCCFHQNPTNAEVALTVATVHLAVGCARKFNSARSDICHHSWDDNLMFGVCELCVVLFSPLLHFVHSLSGFHYSSSILSTPCREAVNNIWLVHEPLF